MNTMAVIAPLHMNNLARRSSNPTLFGPVTSTPNNPGLSRILSLVSLAMAIKKATVNTARTKRLP